MVQKDLLRDILRPEGSILIVFDVHRSLYEQIFNREEFLYALNAVINSARRAKVPIIFTRITPYPQGFQPPNLKLPWRGRFRPEGAELIVSPKPEDIIIDKNTWSLFVGTNVERLLINSHRYTVVFTGIATEVGIETSARHAYTLGFIPVIISDAVSSYDKEAHERSLANMKIFFPVITSKELENYW
ncbi:isochorismatase family cysteine hydrolase [Vulcanisaeta thermophila]|uniref:isochorismatase family cysteine hydrolase n=1 Tax=Vulcanisaeta thermophila TaxID=867917 RepID=UPI000853EF2E|nr:isochorismatase family cysteine hydrolase [Vulcanisaeta thermophila]